MLARSDLRDRAVQPPPPPADGSKSTCDVDFLPEARHGGMLSPSGARINAFVWRESVGLVQNPAPQPGFGLG
jgi:hypothetical protein